MKDEKRCAERHELFALPHQMLDASEAAKVRAHVETCAACRGVVEGYHQLDAVLEEWKPEQPSPWFDARVRAAVAARRPARRGWLSWNWGRWLAPALAALVIVAGVVVVRTSRSPLRIRTAARGHLRAAVPGATASSTGTGATPNQTKVADEELKLYENLPELENYDLLSSFDVLSELPKGAGEASGDRDVAE